jgi:hypothetical protein
MRTAPGDVSCAGRGDGQAIAVGRVCGLRDLAGCRRSRARRRRPPVGVEERHAAVGLPVRVWSGHRGEPALNGGSSAGARALSSASRKTICPNRSARASLRWERTISMWVVVSGSPNMVLSVPTLSWIEPPTVKPDQVAGEHDGRRSSCWTATNEGPRGEDGPATAFPRAVRRVRTRVLRRRRRRSVSGRTPEARLPSSVTRLAPFHSDRTLAADLTSS